MARYTLTLSLALALTVVSAAAEHAVPRPFEAHYSGKFSGFRVEIDATLAVVGDAVSFRRYSEPRGFARVFRRDGALECGRYAAHPDGPVPEYYAYVDGKPGKGKSVTVSFADDGTVASSTYRGAAVELDVSDGAVDKIAEERLVAARLAAATSTEFTLRVVDRNEVHNVAYRVLGRESLTVPAGQFETVLVERRRGNSSRTTRFWAAPELDYQPVRIQRLKDGKLQGTANLEAFAWVDQARGSVTPRCP